VCPVLQSDLRDGLFTAVAQVAMRVSRIAAARLQTAERESEPLKLALRACRKAVLLQVRQNIACGGFHSAEQRLSRALLEAADRLDSSAVSFAATQEQVARRLGVRRTTVTLLAGRLQDVGAIHWGRGSVEILERARLESMACSCYAALRERIGTLVSADPARPAQRLAG
jgi:CRP-like cAMP-binding protein